MNSNFINDLMDNSQINVSECLGSFDFKSSNNFSNKKKVVVLSKVNIENGAGGTRILNLTKILNYSNKFDIACYGFSNCKNKGEIIEQKDNYRIMSIGNYSSLKGIKKYKIIFYNKRIIRQIFEKEMPDIVIVYSTLTLRNISFIKKYTKKYNIKLVFDVVEFRSLFSSLSLRAFFGYNLHNNLISTHFINNETDGVIVPTHFLEDYFKNKRKCNYIFYLPITMNVEHLPKYNKNFRIKQITFLYAGNPNKKRDLLANMIKAFVNLPIEYRKRVALVVCGICPQQIIKREGLSKADYEKSLEFTYYLGSIPKTTLNQIYPNIDYCILLKNPNKRFSKAGFPTKMAECFACGIPMVCNLSGDMSYFVKDGFNAIVSPTYRVDDFVDAIKRAIDFYPNHKMLSENALAIAKKHLHNRTYFDLSDFIEKEYE